MDDIDNVLNGINSGPEENPNQKIDDLVSQSEELGTDEEYDLYMHLRIQLNILNNLLIQNLKENI